MVREKEQMVELINDRQVIFGVTKLTEWLNISKPTVYKLIQMGMPCEKLDGIWIFHKGNINAWFKSRTLNQRPKDPTGAK